MLIVFENNDPDLEQRYQLWRETSDKPLRWEEPPFDLEICYVRHGTGKTRNEGFLLFTWQQKRLSFRGESLFYYQLDYSSTVDFWLISKRMSADDLARRYRSQCHANTRWFSLICQAYDAWYEAGKPEAFRFVA